MESMRDKATLRTIPDVRTSLFTKESPVSIEVHSPQIACTGSRTAKSSPDRPSLQATAFLELFHHIEKAKLLQRKVFLLRGASSRVIITAPARISAIAGVLEVVVGRMVVGTPANHTPVDSVGVSTVRIVARIWCSADVSAALIGDELRISFGVAAGEEEGAVLRRS